MAKKAQRPFGSRQAVVQEVNTRATAATPQHATHRTQQPTRSEQTHTKLPGTRAPQAWTHTYNHEQNVTQSTWDAPDMLHQETRQILARYEADATDLARLQPRTNRSRPAAPRHRSHTAGDFIRGAEHHKQTAQVVHPHGSCDGETLASRPRTPLLARPRGGLRTGLRTGLLADSLTGLRSGLRIGLRDRSRFGSPPP